MCHAGRSALPAISPVAPSATIPERLDARLAVPHGDDTVEGADRRLPTGEAPLHRGDEARDVVELVEFGECADLAADRRQVHALDGALAGDDGRTAGEGADHLARRAPAEREFPVDRRSAGDRIDACGPAQDGADVRAGEPERPLPLRHRRVAEAAFGFQRAVEEPAAERAERQRPLGRGEVDLGLLDPIGAENQGVGVERQGAGETVEDREVDRLVGPSRRRRQRVPGVGARTAGIEGRHRAAVPLVRRREAAAQPCEVERAGTEIGVDRRRLLIQAEEDSAAHPVVAERGADAGNVGRRLVSRDRPHDVQRAEDGVGRHAADHRFDQGLDARVGNIDGGAVARRREGVHEPAGDVQHRTGRLRAQIDPERVEIAVEAGVDRQRPEPRDGGGRCEPDGAGERGGIRCAEVQGERAGRRIEGSLDRACQRHFGGGGGKGEIDRERVRVASQRAVERDLAVGLGANVGIDVEKSGGAGERVGLAVDRERDGRRRPDPARVTPHREACTQCIRHRRPAHAQVAVFEEGVELQPGEAHAVVCEGIDRQRDIGIDLGKRRPRAGGRVLRCRTRRLLRCGIGAAGLGRWRGAGGGGDGGGEIGIDIDGVDRKPGGEARPLARLHGRAAGDPRGVDADVEAGCRYPIVAGGDVDAGAEAAEPVRRDGIGIHGKPCENGTQIVRRDFGRSLEPGALAAARQPARELDIGAAGQQRRGLPDRDHAVLERKLMSGPDERRPGAR